MGPKAKTKRVASSKHIGVISQIRRHREEAKLELRGLRKELRKDHALQNPMLPPGPGQTTE